MIITACHSQPSYDSRLLLADSIMQDCPDSALALLRNLNASDLSSEADVALHALLLSQAYDKNYIDLTNDSLISIAVDYFSEGNEPRYAMLAHYYHACVLFNAQKYSDCVLACMKAEEYVTHVKDHLTGGLLYRLLYLTMNHTYNASDAEKYAELSYSEFVKANRAPYIRHAYIALARAYNNNHKFDKSISTYKKIISEAQTTADSLFISNGMNEYAHVLFILKDFTTAKQTLLSLNSIYGIESLNPVSCGHMAQIYAKEQKIDSAWIYAHSGEVSMKTELDFAAVYKGIYTIYREAGDFKNALNYYKKYVSTQNACTDSIMKQSVVKMQRDYHKQEVEKTQIQKQNAKLVNSILIVILISGIILITLYYFYTRNKHRAQAEKSKRIIANSQNLAQQIELLSAKLSSQEHELHTEKSITDTLKKEITATKTLLQSLKLQHETKLENQDRIRAAITSSKEIQQVRSLIDNNQPIAPDFWIDIESLILTYYPQFKDTLLEICSLNEKEYKLCILLKAEFTPTEISKILCSSKENVSSMRRRLYTKFFKKAGKPKDFDDFIVKL